MADQDSNLETHQAILSKSQPKQQHQMQQMQHQQPPPHQQVAYNPDFNPSAPMLPDPTSSLGHIQQPVDYMNWGAPSIVQMPAAVHGGIVPEGRLI